MKKFLSVIMIISMVCALPAASFGASANWTGGDLVNADWSDTDNWDAAPVPGTGDTATFNAAAGAGGAIINLGGAVTAGSIIFDTANADAYTIGVLGVDTLTLDNGGGIVVNNLVDQTQTVAANILLSPNASLSNNGANDLFLLSVTGNVTGGAADGTLTLNGSDTGDNIISGNIADGVGALAVTKNEAGTWILSGNNAYSGGTTLAVGTLNINSDTALGAAAGKLTINGGILGNSSGGNRVLTNGNEIDMNGNFAYTSNDDLDLGAGAVTLGANRAVTVTTAASVLAINGIIGDGAGTFGLEKLGAGILELGGVNTFGGGVTLTAGQLNLGDANALGSGAFVIAGGTTIDNSAVGALTLTTDNAQTWNGDFTFAGANDLNLGAGTVALGASTRTVTLTAGMLTVGGVISGGGAAVGLTTAGAGTMTLSGVNLYTGATSIGAGSTLALDATGTIAASSGVANEGTFTIAAAKTIDSLTGAGATTLGDTLTIGDASGTSGSYTGVASGAGGITKAGAGTLTLSGDNDYTGVTTVSGGILSVDKIGNGGVAGSVGAAAAAAGNQVLNGGVLSYTGNAASTDRGFTVTASGGEIDVTTVGQTLTIETTGISAAGALTIGGAGNTLISSVISGAGGLVKDDGGTLTLNGLNTYAGGTTVNAGTLALTGNDLTSNVNFSGDATLAAATGIEVIGNITNTNTGEGTLALGGAHDLAGNIGSTGLGLKLITVGNGAVAIDGDVKAKKINFAADNTLNIADGHTITTSSGADAGLTSTAGNTGTLAFAGSGTCDAAIGNNAWASRIKEVQVSAGTVAFNKTVWATTGTITGGTMQLGASGTSAFGLIDHQGGALDLGTFTMTLDASGAGDYTQTGTPTLRTAIQSSAVAGNIDASAAGSGIMTTLAASVLFVTVPSATTIPVGTKWIILNGKDDSGGVVAPTTVTSSNPRVSFSAAAVNGAGGDDDLELTVLTWNTDNVYTNAASNGNSAAAGASLDAITNPTGDMATVLSTLDALSGPQIAAALDTMVPEVDAGVINTSTTVLNNFVGVSLERTEEILMLAGDAADSAETGVSSGDMTKASGVWAKGYGSFLTQGVREGIQGYDAWNAGTALGMDCMITESFTVGVSGGYAYGDVDSNVNNANTNINSAQTTIYGGYAGQSLPFFIDAAGSFAYNWYNGRRDINVGGSILRTADASYDGQQYGAYIGGGYKFNLTEAIELTPLASLQWNHLILDAYTETEAGALNLSIGRQSYNQLQSGLGARIAAPKKYEWGNLTPEIHGKWLYDFIGDDMVVASTFTGGGPSFNANGANPALNSFNLGGRLILNFRNDITVIADCDTEVKDDFFGIFGSLTLRYRY